MRKRHVLLWVVIMTTVILWYSVDYRIKRAHTTAVTPHEFRLFSLIMGGWGLYFYLEVIQGITRLEGREAVTHGT